MRLELSSWKWGSGTPQASELMKVVVSPPSPIKTGWSKFWTEKAVQVISRMKRQCFTPFQNILYSIRLYMYTFLNALTVRSPPETIYHLPGKKLPAIFYQYGQELSHRRPCFLPPTNAVSSPNETICQLSGGNKLSHKAICHLRAAFCHLIWQEALPWNWPFATYLGMKLPRETICHLLAGKKLSLETDHLPPIWARSSHVRQFAIYPAKKR